jgi:tetratricopeptide (TPR) repeat protein
VSAYFTGKKAIKYLRKALKVNPEMKDANMGLGIFDYYVATLPAVVRVLAFIGSGGDSKVGIQELTVAAYESEYAQIPSKLFLAEIYSNPENKPEKALEILGELRKDHPNSPFIHMMIVIAHYNHNHLAELASEAQNFQDRVDQGVYDKKFTVQSRFALAAVQFKGRHWEEAIKQYDLGIAAGTVKDPFWTWSHLYKAYALDALGQHDKAVPLYKSVLSQLRRWGSWDAAKKYMNKPFPATDEDLKKLRL